MIERLRRTELEVEVEVEVVEDKKQYKSLKERMYGIAIKRMRKPETVADAKILARLPLLLFLPLIIRTAENCKSDGFYPLLFLLFF